MHDLAAYWSDGFKKVAGWVEPGLFNYIEHVGMFQERQKIVGNTAEIGVFEGRFLIALAHLTRPGETCLALDVFDEQDKNVDGCGIGDLTKLQNNINLFAPADVNFVYVQADSLALTAGQKIRIAEENGPFRIISIDGCHTREHTTNDLMTAQDWLATGGIVIVDDYYNMHWPGVHEGVGQFFANGTSRLKPLLYSCNKLFLTTFAYHKRYFNSFSGTFKGSPQFKIVSMYGSDVVVCR